MEVIKGSQSELTKKAADIIAKKVEEIAQNQPHVHLAIPGGRSVGPIFKLLTEADIDWEKVHIFILDERMVPPSSVESNFHLALNTLVKPLFEKKKIPMNHIHPYIYDEQNEEQSLNDYEAIIKTHGGRFDIILLSSGEDGHIGGLYPNHHSIKSNNPYLVQMDDSPKKPPKRISASRSLLEQAKVSIILFFGEAKKEAFESFQQEGSVEQCPARLVKQLKESYVLTDL